MKFTFFLHTIMLLLAAAASAQAGTVQALVDRNRITDGESLSLQVSIEDGDGQVDLSGLNDFKTVSRGSTSSFQMINGQTTNKMIYNYILIPLKTGELTIPAIPVTIDGKVQATEPIRIMVTKESAVDSGRRDVFVKAEVSKENPWLGEQIVYTFRLFNAVSLAPNPQFQTPSFEGFHTERLDNRNTYASNQVINGREYNVSEVSFILIPLKTGPLTIDPAVIQVGVLKKSRRNPFADMDGLFGRTVSSTRILKTKPLSINVRQLPEVPDLQAGDSFSGLIGHFDLKASLDKTDLQTGDSSTLAITISGTGNIMDAAAPPLPIPDDCKSYADHPEEDIRKKSGGISGSKTFRTALVPVNPGEYHIAPVRLTYFDVDRGTYQTVQSSGFTLKVAQSKAEPTDIHMAQGKAPAPSLKKKVEFTGRDILPLKQGVDALESPRHWSTVWFPILLLLPFLGFLITLVTLRLLKKDDSPERLMAERSAQAIKTASDNGVTNADFLTALYRALVSAILGKRGMTGTSLTWAEAHVHLSAIGWEEEAAKNAAQLLEEIETFNYSNKTLDADKRAKLLNRTRQTLGRLSK